MSSHFASNGSPVWPTATSVHTIGYGPRPFAGFAWEVAAAGVTDVGVAVAQIRVGSVAANLRALADFGVTDVVQPSAFTIAEPTWWDDERDVLRSALDLAAGIGAPILYTTTGPAPGLQWAESVARFCDAVAPVREHANALGVRLAVENTIMLRSDLSFAHRLADVVDLARAAQVWACADLFSAWAERDVFETLAANTDVFALVQLADYVLGTFATPGRAALGDGVVPVARQLEVLRDAGYVGPLEVELIGPRIDEEGVAAAGMRSLRAMAGLLAR